MKLNKGVKFYFKIFTGLHFGQIQEYEFRYWVKII